MCSRQGCWEQGAKKSLHTLVAGVFVRRRKGGVFAAALRLPAPQPALLSHNTVPIMLADTLQVVLCIQRSCFHNVTVAEGWGWGGWGVRRSVWWRSNQKNRSGRSNLCLNYEERERSQTYFHEKRSAGRLRSVWECMNLKSTSSFNQPQQFPPSTQVNDP